MGDSKEEPLPPGFRFHPTDDELLSYYLTQKISDSSYVGRAIADVDLNKCEPWDLPGKAKMGEKEWYFFSLRDRKYPTGLRTNRATDSGYWKTTGKDKEVFRATTSELAGTKKTLVFYKGRAPKGEKTSWVMHEYRLIPEITFKTGMDEWVVCRIFQKNTSGKKYTMSRQHLNPYDLDMGPTTQLNPDPFHAGMGRTFHANGHTSTRRGFNMSHKDEMTELTRLMLQAPPQLAFQGGLYQPSLNPNNTSQQAGLPPMPVVWSLQQPMAMDTVSSLLAGGEILIGTGPESTSNSRFHQVNPRTPCVELEPYWATFMGG
ncbi:NAC domain-containing protein 92 isoform X1 [Amborella trichopoda]|uniref:NAC domain-containing protein n=1 Tax=Amborella trichopoda TaxID=13333 RepID=W1PYC3_AMBTC|nr:NAC domain-containing protein 92 isoform X1 [Amborella trichopoda]ERN12495.1 hypothetical protein AMTR_s00025p00174590 [Amborella trichopoda]|eukprot:XP_006850914.1 NAC domain-containing protein 92 isoform X1 [Amborella trichopoda]